VREILDAGECCHVGVQADGPIVLPMAYGRANTLYLHGSGELDAAHCPRDRDLRP
jgi:nitroimidazol reductase NimA-like FMN-containing flavoprotein (pyridoxamine 5'-phosphate oxidase superfamily)